MQSPEPKKIFGLNPNIFFVGMVSFLTDVSSELIFTLMPLFLSNVLQTGPVIIGLIEGIAESTASLLKIISGWLSDKFNDRKNLSFIGYLLSTLAKPFMLIASTWVTITAIRFTDRVGKGIRTAPRDALVSDSCSENERGKAFGFHRAMDTGGAALGLILSAGVVFLLQKDVLDLQSETYRWLIILGLIPAFLSLIFFIFIHEPRNRKKTDCQSSPNDEPVATVTVPSRISLNIKFRIFLFIVFVFTLGNSSDAFLILRAQNVGNSVLLITLMLVMFNLIYAFSSTPAGILSDKIGRRTLLVGGWSLYALVYLGFAIANQNWMIWLLFSLYGLYYGLAEGVARALVCDLVPADKVGTAFGMYHGVVGITLLPASLIAGWLWQAISPAAPFYFGAVMALIAVIGLMLLLRKQPLYETCH